MKNEGNRQKESSEERPFTFKITKRRSPWTKEEDDGITELVNKYRTGNWTLIANEMSNLYAFRNRSGKQCRERWHNHLDPNINKDYWTEKEENVLFLKHMEYGNKWSDIAKFLPGRTDNAIKNHFYSKLRKFIRKILKQINKDHLFKASGIDPNISNSDKVYKMIKENKLAYNTLNKDSIMNMIFNYEKNNKGTRGDVEEARGGLLKNKTKRGKRENSHYQKENLYSERISKRSKKSNEESQLSPIAVTTRSKTLGGSCNKKFEETEKRRIMKQTATSTRSRRLNTTAKRSKEYEYDYYDEIEDDDYLVDEGLNFVCSQKRERKEEEKFKFAHNRPLQPIISANDENGHDLVKQNLNIIINQSLLFNKYLQEEEEKSKSISENKSTTKISVEPESSMNNHHHMENAEQKIQPNCNLHLEEKLFQAVPSLENLPLISLINPNTKIYPSSTRNYFNNDSGVIQQEDKTAYQTSTINQPYFEGCPIPQIEGLNCIQLYNSLQNLVNLTSIAQTPQSQYLVGSYSTPAGFIHTLNKEINLQNKILINERTASMGAMIDQTDEGKEEHKEGRYVEYTTAGISGIPMDEQISQQLLVKIESGTSGKSVLKKPSIDLNVINQSEINKIFFENGMNEYTSQSIQEEQKKSFSENYNRKNEDQTAMQTLQKRTILTPTAASLSISPKSAFAKYSKEAKQNELK